MAAVLVLVLSAACSAAPTVERTDPPASSAGSNPAASPDAPDTEPGTAPGTDTDRSDDRDVAPIGWEACGTGQDCATYEVPADYADPEGPTVALSVIRRRATGPDRIGSLFVNPGGPGGSGVDYVRATPVDRTLNQYFDIVSWDPRGVGASEPISCNDRVEELRSLDWSPDDDAEQGAFDEVAEAVADRCAADSGDRLEQVATDATARDLDRLRRAVGDETLSYLGFSYGTILGLRYLDLFPEHVRAMTLDGVVDPTQDLEELLTDQAVGFERSITESFDRCVASGTCPVTDPAESYEHVAAIVESAPLVVPGGDVVGPTALAYAALSSAYDEARGRTFIAALGSAEQGDGAPLHRLAELYFASTSYSEYAAVVCTDNPHPTGASEYRAMTERLAKAAPRFGAAVAAEMAPCAYWAAPVTGAPTEVTAVGSPPILVVGNTGDAATPFEAAQRVAGQLDSGVLLTYRGTGHTSFNADACVRDVVQRYLVDLVAPAPGTECPGAS